MNGAARATNDASPTPTKARKNMRLPKLQLAPHPAAANDQTPIPIPNRRKADLTNGRCDKDGVIQQLRAP